VASLEVVTDYSSGGCVRISRTSLLLKPYSQLSKKFQPIILPYGSQDKDGVRHLKLLKLFWGQTFKTFKTSLEMHLVLKVLNV